MFNGLVPSVDRKVQDLCRNQRNKVAYEIRIMEQKPVLDINFWLCFKVNYINKKSPLSYYMSPQMN